MGTTLEFQPRDSYVHLTDIVGGGPFDLAPGVWTDDSAMALALALGDAFGRCALWRIDHSSIMARHAGVARRD